MQIDARGINFDTTAAIEGYTRSLISRALGPVKSAIGGVVVRFTDINGSRGGVDKACSMVVSLHRHSPVVVQAVDRDLYNAIHSAVAKLRQAVRRRLTRKRSLRRQPTSPA
jgi:ribosome-associated translation inhibitor RaiA